MGAPERVKIARAASTPFIGRHGDGLQFLSFVCTAPRGASRQWVAALHTFDGDGLHLHTRAACTGDVADASARRRAEACQQGWLRELSTLLLCAVEVAPFATEADGVSFALRLAPDGRSARLLPLGLELAEPWDGTYRVP